MFKKILWILLLLPASSWAFTSGPYVGIGGGVDTADFYQWAHVVVPRNANVIDDEDLAAQGILGTLFGGYALTNGTYYLAAEINGNLSSAKYTSNNDEFFHRSFSHSTYTVNRSWGLSLLPGIAIPDNTLFYGRIGYAGGNFDVDTNDSSLTNLDKYLNGIRFGLGIEKGFCNHFSVLLDYSHIIYGTARMFTVDPISFATKQTNITPSTNQFVLGLNYRV